MKQNSEIIRSIIHLDMDAFYPSVEILDNPELKGMPVIVGGNRERGVVSSASYEARKFGVHSAQPMAQAMSLCSHGVFLPVRMSRYKEVSEKIFEIFKRFTPLMEPLSIDEAFLDVTGMERLLGSPVAIADKIKKTVFEETGLTVSAGIAPSKFVAKIASDIEKPDGLTVVAQDQVAEFLDPLPVGRMWGVGKVTLEKLNSLGIKTFYDLRLAPVEILEKNFGKHGGKMHLLAMGIDGRKVETEHEMKSIGHEETYSTDIRDIESAEKELLALSMKIGRRMRLENVTGRTVTLKVKYSDFKMITRSETLDKDTDDGMGIYSVARGLLKKTETGGRPVRLLGISLSGLSSGNSENQMSLFSGTELSQKSGSLNRAIDSLEKKYGQKSVVPGRLLSDEE